MNCTNNGECLDSVAGAVCNCTDGFAGLRCEIRKLKDAIFNDMCTPLSFEFIEGY